jgi:hypothetical protein
MDKYMMMVILKVYNNHKENQFLKQKNTKKEKKDQMDCIPKTNLIKALKIHKKSLKIMMMIKMHIKMEKLLGMQKVNHLLEIIVAKLLMEWVYSHKMEKDNWQKMSDLSEIIR